MKSLKKSKKFNIVLVGGKSGGPIVPLLALAATWQKSDPQVTPIVIDIKNSTASRLSRNSAIRFIPILAGKFRRYWWAWQNLVMPFLLLAGFIQSLLILIRLRPKVVIGAGGFVQVPVMVAAWLLRIPRVVHQQDVLVSLSNSLCAPIASLITTTFKDSQRDFPQGSGIGPSYLKENKVFWTGNPVRDELAKLPNKELAKKSFGFKNNLPVVLVFGGGSGADAINNLIIDNLPELSEVVQIVHSTGPDKNSKIEFQNYKSFNFIDDMATAYAAADLVIARAGVGTLTELAQVKLPSIIIPMPDTHQELNAGLVYQSQAALVLDQTELTGQKLITAIRKIMFDAEYSKNLVQNMTDLQPQNANINMIKLIKSLLNDK